ncbi:hypothetical protein HK405_002705, partial [Cladochytrium tenue]
MASSTLAAVYGPDLTAPNVAAALAAAGWPVALAVSDGASAGRYAVAARALAPGDVVLAARPFGI